MRNIAYIDGQNLHFGIADAGWKIDFKRFRIYLKDKFNIDEAYYFLGYCSAEQNELYKNLQRAGFIVLFREHKEFFITTKKGNVDVDIVFEMMRSLIEEDFEKIVLVSSDGDYKKVVDYLIEKDKFEKIIFPNHKNASSLYKGLGNRLFMSLNQEGIRKKLEYKKKSG